MPVGTIATANAIVAYRFGRPEPLDIVGFATGAVAAFLVLAALAHPAPRGPIPQRVSSTVVVNVLPLLALVVSPIALLVPWSPLAFWVATFSATLTYGLALAGFLVLSNRMQ